MDTGHISGIGWSRRPKQTGQCGTEPAWSFVRRAAWTLKMGKSKMSPCLATGFGENVWRKVSCFIEDTQFNSWGNTVL